ncbi:MAG: hydrogenase 4 subunit F [Candidatus Scalindua rubra]|uniref:NADH dehydrogenase subunit F n=1 Tax=Candidatus Scalindua brodae TaxID=237368 RepID=A0A0B0ESD9_9BACT|nr:MAG: NADH dehydrogenase subunit F [Candidatus Scalindua brodae]MBZ0107839.1 hydrogenase 4 subunit F [Candidatus Scalindua rubra]TWU29196.1 Hydrogenase-4 component B [Candidatus Brocadiaceae bacterium S225]
MSGILLLLLIPIITAVLCYSSHNRKEAEYFSLIGIAVTAMVSIFLISASQSSPIFFFRGMFFIDALSAYILSIVILVSVAVAIYSVRYMGREFQEGLISIKELKDFYALLHLFIFTMLLAAVSNNIAIFWVAIESTTIVSSLLVGFYKDRESIEAAWKYIILCTVSLVFGLLGVFIIYYASSIVLVGEGTLNWTELREIAHDMNPKTVKLAFLFILVGYGAKAGFAPIHNWLPDAHSQAPTPVSALLSGVLIKCAFLGIIRFAIIGNECLGISYCGNLLMIFGLVSMGVASAFILVQNNFKRLLAYSSIEHIGIIAIGMGIGGFCGVYGSLLHMLNHAIVKPLLFFTTGEIKLKYHTTAIDKIKGAMVTLPIVGTVMLVAALAIAGAPPFNIFLSEFTILKAAVDGGNWVTFSLFIIFATIIFAGLLRNFGSMVFGRPNIDHDEQEKKQIVKNGNKIGIGIIVVMAVIMLVLGLHIPGFLDEMLKSSVKIIAGE